LWLFTPIPAREILARKITQQGVVAPIDTYESGELLASKTADSIINEFITFQ
jgi:hypothetical protein